MKNIISDKISTFLKMCEWSSVYRDGGVVAHRSSVQRGGRARAPPGRRKKFGGVIYKVKL